MKALHRVIFGGIGMIATIVLAYGLLDGGYGSWIVGCIASTPFTYMVWKALDELKEQKMLGEK